MRDRPPGSGPWVLAAAVLASSMAFIDVTALNVALPRLQGELEASGAELLWIVNSYGLVLAALLLLGGVLGDRHGQRRVFMAGIALFAAASAACGFAPGPRSLIAARVFQGLGGALMIPGSLALITGTFDADRRGRAIGLWSALSVVATALGPVLGGPLAEAGLWRGVFLINVPLAIAALAILTLKVPESRPERQGSPAAIDLPGAFLGTAALLALNYGSIEAPGRGLGDPVILAALIGGVLLGALFVLVEGRGAVPLLPLDLFRSRTFAAACVLVLSVYAPFHAAVFFLSLNLIQAQGYGAGVAGLAQLPVMALLMALSPAAGGLVDRRGPRLPLAAGSALAGAGFLALAAPGLTRGPGEFWWSYLPGLILLGAGLGLSAAPLSATLMAAAPPERAGLVAGIQGALSRTGGVLAVAVLGAVALVAFRSSLEWLTAGLELPAGARAALHLEAARLGDARAPAGLEEAVAAEVQRAVRLSLARAFRIAALACAGMAWSGAVVAGFFLADARRIPAPGDCGRQG